MKFFSGQLGVHGECYSVSACLLGSPVANIENFVSSFCVC